MNNYFEQGFEKTSSIGQKVLKILKKTRVSPLKGRKFTAADKAKHAATRAKTIAERKARDAKWLAQAEADHIETEIWRKQDAKIRDWMIPVRKKEKRLLKKQQHKAELSGYGVPSKPLKSIDEVSGPPRSITKRLEEI